MAGYFDRSKFPVWTPPDWDEVVATPITWDDRRANKAHLSCGYFEDWDRVEAYESITDYVFWSRKIEKHHKRSDIEALHIAARVACERHLENKATTYRDRVRAGLSIMDPVPDTGIV